jgi:hypothetical protein
MLVGPGGAVGGASSEPTPYGFEIPEGDPGEVQAAARACADWATALSRRATDVRTGAQVACSDWTGSAESGFAGFARHVETVYGSVGDAISQSGQQLTTFAHELETAQQLTNRALGECERLDAQVQGHLQDATTHGTTVTDLTNRSATAVTPQESQELSRQLSEARGQQAAAEQAAKLAQGQLEAAERQGGQAWTDYQHQAAAVASALQGLDSRVERVQPLPAAATAHPRQGPGVATTGFWPFFNTAVHSHEKIRDGAMGLAEGIANRYRDSDLLLPITEQAHTTLEDLSGPLADDDPFTPLASGLLVPKGSTVDPMTQRVGSLGADDGFNTPGTPFLVPGEDDLEAAAPNLAKAAGRTLGVAGAGLTLYSTGADQWQYDDIHHPGWSTTEKVADTAQTTVVVGGSTVGGALAGAEVGAEGGAALGATVGSAVPVLGTAAGGVVGGLVGGVAGGIVGGGVGKDVGHGLEDTGHFVTHEASHLWHDVF